MENISCIVLGGYVNSFNIIRELYDSGVRNIALIDYGKSIAKRSNRITSYSVINKNSTDLLNSLLDHRKTSNKLVVFPTDDSHLRFLNEIYDQIKGFVYIPFNNDTLLQSLDKFHQYHMCEELGVPYPKTVNLTKFEDFEKIRSFDFPILIKPNIKNDSLSVFRTMILNSEKDIDINQEKFSIFFDNKFTFVASELIPGDDTNIFAYTGFVNKTGTIMNEWIGKKLTQYPDNYGVFSSASNQAPVAVLDQGRKLLEGMNLRGICEPEFKYDHRDQQYKLMEINLRSMMWHRVGFLDGVALHKSMYDDAAGNTPKTKNQDQDKRIHLVYLKHEILNLCARRGYWKHFKYNVFANNVSFALFDKKDIKPFLYDLPSLLKGILKICLKR